MVDAHGGQTLEERPACYDEWYTPYSCSYQTSVGTTPYGTEYRPVDIRLQDQHWATPSSHEQSHELFEEQPETCYSAAVSENGSESWAIPPIPRAVPSMELGWPSNHNAQISVNYTWSPPDDWFSIGGTEASRSRQQDYQTAPSSVCSMVSEQYDPAPETARHVCGECAAAFENSLTLDQHAKRSSHKSWCCPEIGCGKTYARRDVFLRHRATHRQRRHACPVCPRDKQKMFTRKDHLAEHVKKCQNKLEANGLRSSSKFDDLIQRSAPYSENELSLSDPSQELVVQKRQMTEIVCTLKNILGARQQEMIGRLQDRVDKLDNPEALESVAENMASVALFQANVNAAKVYNASDRR